MLSAVTFLWGTRYTAAHVNRLAAMVARHYDAPYRFVCVTNIQAGAGLDPSIVVVPDAQDFARVQSPWGAWAPSCYRRLRLWHPDAARWFGDRFVSLDIDLVLTADVRPLWDRDDDVVLYRDPLFPTQANGSMLLMRAGATPHVWTDFDSEKSPAIAKAAGFRGSDQAWLSYCLPDAPRWDTADGVYSYKAHVRGKALPADARVVVFHGDPKPWTLPQPAWVREHYEMEAVQ